MHNFLMVLATQHELANEINCEWKVQKKAQYSLGLRYAQPHRGLRHLRPLFAASCRSRKRYYPRAHMHHSQPGDSMGAFPLAPKLCKLKLQIGNVPHENTAICKKKLQLHEVVFLAV